jgi:hypothetical protein
MSNTTSTELEHQIATARKRNNNHSAETVFKTADLIDPNWRNRTPQRLAKLQKVTRWIGRLLYRFRQAKNAFNEAS